MTALLKMLILKEMLAIYEVNTDLNQLLKIYQIYLLYF